jgi:predicted HicB family RNase H-like nuclease
MKNINIQVEDSLHYSLRLWAATSGMTLKSVIIKILEDAVQRQEMIERGQK